MYGKNLFAHAAEKTLPETLFRPFHKKGNAVGNQQLFQLILTLRIIYLAEGYLVIKK